MNILAKKLQKLVRDNIVDIILFGSSVKGASRPSDIDIAVLYHGTIDKSVVKKNIQSCTQNTTDIQFITLQDYDKFIFLTLIREGYSVKNKKYLSEVYRIKPAKLYKYQLTSLTPSKKVMFQRGLRNFKTIEKLSNRVILVPMSVTSEFESFLRQWDLDIDTKEYTLLPLVRQE
ncbi:TPA: hypothetical protein HA278_03385 [Candidatus Woesearchaeota archaeon]|nr:hypothetical protein [Candidatus Woesearchaeota archaeon]